MIKTIGIWKEFGWKFEPNACNVNLFPSKELTYPNRVISYLLNGISLITLRNIIQCIETGEEIGVQTLYTDGKWVWTEAFWFYVMKGRVEIPDAFLTIMEENNYQVPSKKELGQARLLKIKSYLGWY